MAMATEIMVMDIEADMGAATAIVLQSWSLLLQSMAILPLVGMATVAAALDQVMVMVVDTDMLVQALE